MMLLAVLGRSAKATNSAFAAAPLLIFEMNLPLVLMILRSVVDALFGLVSFFLLQRGIPIPWKFEGYRPSWSPLEVFQVGLFRSLLERASVISLLVIRSLTFQPKKVPKGTKLGPAVSIKRSRDLRIDERSYPPSIPDQFEAEMVLPEAFPEGEKCKKLVIFTHGGGFIFGSPQRDRTTISKFVKKTGIPALSIRYALAPEFPYPCSLMDAISAFSHARNEMGLEAHDIALAGASAGANLAFSTAVWLRDNRKELPACIVLLSPVFEQMGCLPSRFTMAKIDYLPRTWIPEHEKRKGMYSYYLHKDLDAVFSPYVSGMFVKPTEVPLCPILIQTGAVETLRDDAIAFTSLYEKRCETMKLPKSKIVCELYADCVHVFQDITHFKPETEIANERAAGFLKEHLEEKAQLQTGETNSTFFKVSKVKGLVSITRDQADEMIQEGYELLRKEPHLTNGTSFQWKFASLIWPTARVSMSNSE
jgi:monoterpene epsilon-lactone hydrolase